MNKKKHERKLIKISIQLFIINFHLDDDDGEANEIFCFLLRLNEPKASQEWDECRGDPAGWWVSLWEPENGHVCV